MAISPKLKILVYRPFESAPAELPVNLLSRVESTRGMNGGTIGLTFSPGMESGKGLRSMSELLPDQSVVQLLVQRKPNEKFRQLNIGYVEDASSTISATGQARFNPTIKSLDQKLKTQTLFIDAPEEGMKGQPDSNLPGSAFERNWIQFGEAFRETSSLKRLLTGVWDSLICEMMNPESVGGYRVVFGGRRLVKKSSEADGFTGLIPPETAYSDGFIHVFSFMQQNRFGSTPNMYQILTGLVSPPLYELFSDPLEGEGLLEGDSTYRVVQNESPLIFRKTPFDVFWTAAGEYKTSMSVPVDAVKRVTNRTIGADLFSIVHVGSAMFERDGGNTLIHRPMYQPYLIARYGYRVMKVIVEGLAPTQSRTEAKQGEAVQKASQGFQDIQKRLFTLFLGGEDGTVPLRNTQSSVECTFDFYRVGDILRFEQPDPDYGDVGYAHTVTDVFDLRSNSATSTVSMKWVDRKS